MTDEPLNPDRDDGGKHVDPVDDERRHQRRVTTVALAVVLALALVVPGLTIAVAVLYAQVDGLTRALDAEQEHSERSGIDPVAPPPGKVKDDPDTPIRKAPPARASDEQVRRTVAAYFRDHPVRDGETPKPAEIAAAVARHLKANPPVTGDQIADAVEVYLTEHPPSPGPTGASGETGPPGERGEPGRPPTAEEIAAAVRAYIEAHPLPVCPDGTEAQARTVLTTDGPIDAVICERI